MHINCRLHEYARNSRGKLCKNKKNNIIKHNFNILQNCGNSEFHLFSRNEKLPPALEEQQQTQELCTLACMGTSATQLHLPAHPRLPQSGGESVVSAEETLHTKLGQNEKRSTCV